MSNIECLNEYVSTGNLPQQDAFIKKSTVLGQVRKFQTHAYIGIAYFRSSNRSKIRFNLKLSMKKFVFFVLGSLTMLGLQAQGNEPYEFKEYKRYAATPIKSQDQTGTCWAFSTASFLESEALRLGKGETDLSEMFIVRHIYRMKCENYVRRQGTAQFGEGGLAHDMLNAVARFGIVPQSVYQGRQDLDKPFNHASLEKALKEKCDEFVEQGKKGKLDPSWLEQIDVILDAEFGPAPTKFSYNHSVFSPQSYRDFLGINPEDYVSITSFTHHPFWGKFTLEVPDNWSNGEFYNLPLDDMMRCATYAIEKGYTLDWDTDNSNMGFSRSSGLAIVPKTPWQEKSASARANSFKNWEPELKISQEYRQQLFDRQETTDDHLMHIIGVLDEKHSGIYFIVKNSWGEISPLKGYVYASEAYLRLNTLSFTLPKMALPVDIKRRLGLEQGQVNIEQKEEKELKPVKPAKISNESRRKPTESKDTLKPQPIKRPVDGGNN